MNEYIQISCSPGPEKKDALIGLLSQSQVVSIWEEDLKVHAYFSNEDWLTEEKQVSKLMDQLGLEFKVSVPKDENWNRKWEESFDPVEVDKFCRIRAQFHPYVEGFEHELIIDPKMAFGTGHHATTFMVIRHMSMIDFSGKAVLDYGMGTGILSILASMLGAEPIVGVDIESKAVENAKENSLINGVENISWIEGTLERINGQFDIVLANINRHVILGSLNRLKEILNPNGVIIFSGILTSDEGLIRAALVANNFQIKKLDSKGEWLSIIATHA